MSWSRRLDKLPNGLTAILENKNRINLMLNYQVKRKLKLFILALISYYCFSIPVQAYAGPGVAIEQ